MDLRKYLFLHDFVIADVARKAGMQRTRLSAIVNGRVPLSKKAALKIEKGTNGELSQELLYRFLKRHKE
jgi:plasmid maintenance system antidote protein VapI